MAARLRDDDIVRIFRLLHNAHDLKSCSLVCRRWLRVYGTFRTEIRLFDWMMLESGRLLERFPSLTSIDLCPAWSNSSDPEVFGATAVQLTRGDFTMRLDPDVGNPFAQTHCIDEQCPSPDRFDSGLRVLVAAYPMLRCLRLVDVFRVHPRDLRQDPSPDACLPHSFYCIGNPAAGRKVLEPADNVSQETREQRSLRLRYAEDYTESGPQGLAIVAENCPTLLELEIRQCTDDSLAALEGCYYLQVVRLVGAVPGLYFATFTDKGLRSLAQNCNRLVELSLAGCSIGKEGLLSIAYGCPMLLELTLSGRDFQPDWISALPSCQSLQTLRLENFQQQFPEEAAAALQEMSRIEEGQEDVQDDMEGEEEEDGEGEEEPQEDDGEEDGVERTPRKKRGKGQRMSATPATPGGRSSRAVAPVERLQLIHCDLRSEVFLHSLLRVCVGVKALEIRNCWGLEDNRIVAFNSCSWTESLDIEGCPRITTRGLEAVVIYLRDLRQLSVVNCSKIRDEEISERLADIVFSLKELKWQPSAGKLASAGLMKPGSNLLLSG